VGIRYWVFWYYGFGIRHPVSCILYPVSGFLYSASLYPVSGN
jgi:hypothetical protein